MINNFVIYKMPDSTIVRARDDRSYPYTKQAWDASGTEYYHLFEKLTDIPSHLLNIATNITIAEFK